VCVEASAVLRAVVADLTEYFQQVRTAPCIQMKLVFVVILYCLWLPVARHLLRMPLMCRPTHNTVRNFSLKLKLIFKSSLNGPTTCFGLYGLHQVLKLLFLWKPLCSIGQPSYISTLHLVSWQMFHIYCAYGKKL
jgi:hypothetical protein